MTDPEVKILNMREHVFDVFGKDLFHAKWGEMSKIIVEGNVWIDCSSIILGPCRIGKGSNIPAGSVVTRGAQPYSIIREGLVKIIK